MKNRVCVARGRRHIPAYAGFWNGRIALPTDTACFEPIAIIITVAAMADYRMAALMILGVAVRGNGFLKDAYGLLIGLVDSGLQFVELRGNLIVANTLPGGY